MKTFTDKQLNEMKKQCKNILSCYDCIYKNSCTPRMKANTNHINVFTKRIVEMG